MPDAEDCPNPLSQRDAIALIGLTATLGGLVMAGHIHPQDRQAIRSRLHRSGTIPAGTAIENDQDISDALDALNQRLRWVLGEYDSPPS